MEGEKKRWGLPKQERDKGKGSNRGRQQGKHEGKTGKREGSLHLEMRLTSGWYLYCSLSFSAYWSACFSRADVCAVFHSIGGVQA